MKKHIFALLSGLLLFTQCVDKSATVVADYQVVPLPKSINLEDQEPPFVMKRSTKIAVESDSLINEALFLQEYIEDLTGRRLDIADKATDNCIRLGASLDSSNPEAYEISVDNKCISINGATSAGTFYGVQTLRKAIPGMSEGCNVEFPAVKITDYPRFGYRGAHLDVARHPMEADSVKVYIDMLALHNINRFHWHLSDDQGWRIEIKKYPKLTEIGSKRGGTMVGLDWSHIDSIPVTGYYTQDEARDIVKYAADRHITIIPEIDLPGHMTAALAAYPELGCTGGPYEVGNWWGVYLDALCAGNDSVYEFIDGVLNEIADIFPSEIIHIGGDECHKDRWQECPKCQAKIRELGLKSDEHSTAEAKLQSYVMKRAEESLAKRGRRVIGWDEILEGGVTPDAMIMSWRGAEGGVTAAKSGHDAVMSPVQYCYFNYCQSDDPSTEPLGFMEYLPLEKVYSFEPVAEELTAEEAKHIIGVQANLWREFIKTLSHAQYMALPRMAAVSEVQWCNAEQKNYEDFLSRLNSMIRHYEANSFNYRPVQ